MNKLTTTLSAAATVAFALTTINAGAENFIWRGTTDNNVWDTTSLNWATSSSESARKAWVNNSSNGGSTVYLDSQGATDITVDDAGVEGFAFNNGGTHTLSGGPVMMRVVDVRSGNLTIYNRMTCTASTNNWGFRMIGGNGTITVGDGGYLDAYFAPYNQDYAAKLVILTNGTFKATFSQSNLNNSNKPTIYFNGGALLHTHNDWKNHITFGNTKMVIGAGGMVVLDRASSGNTYLPRPIGTDPDLPTDGGIIIPDHSSYILFEKRANHTYRGGLHIKGITGSIGIEEGDSSYGSALGAAPATPMDDIFFESPSNTVSCKLVSHSGATLGPTRNIRIGNGVTACIGGYNGSSPWTIKGTISCENPEHGFLETSSSGSMVTLDPGANRTNFLSRLFVATPTVIASGTTLLQGSTGDGYGNSSPLHVRSGGSLTVAGSEVIMTGGGQYATLSGPLVVSNGFVDLQERELLHSHAAAATTTVKLGGRLNVGSIRMSGGGSGGDASKSVLNLETDGVVRVTGDIFIHENLPNFKATVNCNGGTFEWANTNASHNCPVNASGGDRYKNTQDGLSWIVKEGGLVVSNDVICYFRPALISGAASDGGITKWGTATFALFTPGSTFNGPIAIMQGEFRQGNAGVVPANCTARVAANASLSPNTYDLTLARVEGSGTFKELLKNGTKLLSVTSAIAPGMGAEELGTLTFSSGGINIADNTALEIDVDEEGNSDSISYPENLDLSKLTLQVNDTSKLRKDCRYTIARVASGMSISGEFISTNLPDGWTAKIAPGGRSLFLEFPAPFTMVVR